MNRKLAWGIGALTMLSLGAVGYRLMTPKFVGATKAEIKAVLPPYLKQEPVIDTASRARYQRLVAIYKKVKITTTGSLLPGPGPGPGFPPVRSKSSPATTKITYEGGAKIEDLSRQVNQILKEGPIQDDSSPAKYASTFTSEKDFFKTLGLEIMAAEKRGNARLAIDLAITGLNLNRALRTSLATIIGQLVSIAEASIIHRYLYDFIVEHRFTEAERQRLLAVLPIEDGTAPQMASVDQTEFWVYRFPYLENPRESFRKEAEASAKFEFEEMGAEETPPEMPAGNFDAIATAKFFAEISQAQAEDAGLSPHKRTGKAMKMADAALNALPAEPDGTDKGFTGWRKKMAYRVQMNLIPNSLGRSSFGLSSSYGTLDADAISQTETNLVRAVLELKTGHSVKGILDPFSGKDLIVDTKRKIVYSVGKDRKDDGGQLGRGKGDKMAPDFGFSYQ